MNGPTKLPKEMLEVMSESFDRLGLSVNALVGVLRPASNRRPPSIKIRGEVSSDGPDFPSFELKVLVYDADGDLMSEGHQHYPSETFDGFDTIDIWVDDIIAEPVRIRVLAKAWG